MFVAPKIQGNPLRKLRRSDMFLPGRNLPSKHVAPTELFREESGGIFPFYKHTTPTELNVIAQVEIFSS
jgi:hypothetical protein